MDLSEITIDIFLDLSKAFDTIDHTILLHKLKYYGLEQSTLRLIESYFKNRKQKQILNFTFNNWRATRIYSWTFII